MYALSSNYVSELSFVNFNRSTERIIEYWDVKCSGNWAEDNARGRAYARELIESMRANGDPNLLGRVAQAITAKGVYGGCETGFFSEISSSLMTGR